MLHFVNVRVVIGDAISRLDVRVSGGLIVGIEAPGGAVEEGEVTIDGAGALLCPGFIDVQCNGGWGTDLSTPSLSRRDVDALLEQLPSTGVTSVVATLVSSSHSTYAAAVPVLRACALEPTLDGARRPLARLLGLHLEGPVMALERKGAHAPQHLRVASAAASPGSGADDAGAAPLFDVYGIAEADWAAGLVRVVTLAPELPGSLDAVRALASRGVAVSIGHSSATLAEATRALRAGACCVTHAFNAMPQLHHREPGLLGVLGRPAAASSAAGAAGAREAVAASPASPPLPFFDASPRLEPHGPPFFGLIADGVHVHPAALTLAFRGGGARNAVLVTDAMCALGAPRGLTVYGELAVEVVDAMPARSPRYPNEGGGGSGGDDDDEPLPRGRAYRGRYAVVAGTSTLAGAVAPMDECVARLWRATGCSAAEAIAAATANPARLLRLEGRVGVVAVGAVADLLLLDPGSLALRRTFVAGVEAYDHGASARDP